MINKILELHNTIWGDVEVLEHNSWRQTGIMTALSARTYLDNVLSKLEKMMDKEFPVYKIPMSDKYYTELEDSDILDADQA